MLKEKKSEYYGFSTTPSKSELLEKAFEKSPIRSKSSFIEDVLFEQLTKKLKPTK